MSFWEKFRKKGGKTAAIAMSKLDKEVRAEIEYMLEDGISPKEINDEFPDVPPLTIYNIHKNMKRRVERKQSAPTNGTNSHSLVQQLQSQIEMEQMRAQLEDIRATREYEHKKRMLELEKLEAEIEVKRSELYEQEDDAIDFMSADGAPNLWGFLSQLLKKNERGDRSTPTHTQPMTNAQTVAAPDPTKPLTREQVQGYMKQFAPHELTIARSVSKERLAEEVRARVPNILDSNVKLIVEEVHA